MTIKEIRNIQEIAKELGFSFVHIEKNVQEKFAVACAASAAKSVYYIIKCYSDKKTITFRVENEEWVPVEWVDGAWWKVREK